MPKSGNVWESASNVAIETESQTEPVIIKKYANRRLYNTDTSSYVTLDDLAEMVRSERDFIVYDAKTGEDLTHAVLTQIIVDQESRGQSLLPIRFLRQLIRLYGDSIERLVPSYLEFSLDSLTREQDRLRSQFANAFGTTAFEAIQEQTRKNLAIFEKAMNMFLPLPRTERSQDETETCASEKTAKPAVDEHDETDEIATLKAQLSAMQDRLDKLSRRST